MNAPTPGGANVPTTTGATTDGTAAATARAEWRIGLACALAIVALWTGFNLVARWGLTGGLTPWDLAFLRYMVAGVCALPLLWRYGMGGLALGRGLVLMLFAGFGFGLFAYNGFARAPVAHGGVLLAGMLPFMTAFGAWLVLGEGWPRRRVVSLLIVAAGVALLAGPVLLADAMPGAWFGDLLFLGGSSSWATYTILCRRWRVPPVPATIAVCVLAAPIYAPIYWLFLPKTIATATLFEIAFQGIYQGLVAVVVALFVYTRALTALGPAPLTTITASVPALTALLGWLILSEPLAPGQMVGVLMVSAGIVVGVGRLRLR